MSIDISEGESGQTLVQNTTAWTVLSLSNSRMLTVMTSDLAIAGRLLCIQPGRLDTMVRRSSGHFSFARSGHNEMVSPIPRCIA